MTQQLPPSHFSPLSHSSFEEQDEPGEKAGNESGPIWSSAYSMLDIPLVSSQGAAVAGDADNSAAEMRPAATRKARNMDNARNMDESSTGAITPARVFWALILRSPWARRNDRPFHS